MGRRQAAHMTLMATGCWLAVLSWWHRSGQHCCWAGHSCSVVAHTHSSAHSRCDVNLALEPRR